MERVGLKRPSLEPNQPSFYKRLREDRKDIRLLKLSPPVTGKLLDIVECSIKTVSLLDRPRYSALSYMWGNPKITKSILVNGRVIQVTQNLEAALRRLRKHRDYRTLWVDAVCINQRDNVEKAWQVQQMWDVYSLAEYTVGWLGEGGSEADRVGRALDEIAGNCVQDFDHGEKEDLDKLKMSFDRALRCLSERGGDALSKLSIREIHAAKIIMGIFGIGNPVFTFPFKDFELFLDLPYWGRLWIVQEFVIGNTRLLWGGTFISTESLIKFAHAFRAISKCWILHQSEESLPGLSKKASQLEEAQAMIWRFSRIKNLSVLASLKRYKLSGCVKQLKLLSLLSVTCLSCQDKLGSSLYHTAMKSDQIFALLGLASDANALSINVNYDSSVADVYTRATRSMLEQGGIWVLYLSQQRKSIEGLPSWVPDWAQDIEDVYADTAELFATNAVIPYGAGGLNSSHNYTSEPILSFELQNNGVTSLNVCGYLVDTVCMREEPTLEVIAQSEAWSAFMKTNPSIDDAVSQLSKFCDKDQLSNWFSRVKNMTDKFTKVYGTRLRVRNGGASYEDNVLLTLAHVYSCDWNARHLRRRTSEDSQQVVDLLGTDSKSFHKMSPIDIHEHTLGLKLSLNYAPFITHHGYLGVGRGSFQSNSCVVVIHGAPLPLLIQRLQGGVYKLIGVCYVDGIMGGEVLQDRNMETFKIV